MSLQLFLAIIFPVTLACQITDFFYEPVTAKCLSTGKFFKYFHVKLI